jgi:hypothetical protein
MIDYASHIVYDQIKKCFVLEFGNEKRELCAEGFQEAVIECELCKYFE